MAWKDYASPGHKRLYEQRKNAGLCPKCGGEPEKYRVLCKACLEKYRANSREKDKSVRDYYKSLGICPACHKGKPEKGFVMCHACLARQRAKYQAKKEFERFRR